MSKRNPRKTNRTRMVPVLIDGITVRMDASSIPKDALTVHHGQTSTGVKVNSASSRRIGDSIVIFPKGQGGPAMSMPNNDFEVMATQVLDTHGLGVTTKLIPSQ